ncbi:MAG: aldehyde dehydrogenase family protein [Methylococcaceae bacterium]|nr:MAG: aldehyde dehydrogenase family protein [Methylococcaceae bacterium]
MNKPRILLVSGGSLVGQNILHILADRRAEVELAATNSAADAISLRDFDTVYLTPETLRERAAFENRFVEILRQEQPDLVIPCRDDDVVFMADFKARHPALSSGFLCGHPVVAEATYDKWASWEFCLTQGLPFAPSLRTPADATETARFAREHGFPLLVKPRCGFASRSVYLVVDEAQLQRAAEREGQIIQRYLGDADDVNAYLGKLHASGVPLFHSLNDIKHSIQIFIAPDGTAAGNFCTVNTRRHGVSMQLDRYLSEDAAALGRRCIEVFARAGWRGPMNIQCRMTPDEGLVIYEFNARLSGASAARHLMGHDEVALALKTFTGKTLPVSPGRGDSVVRRSFLVPPPSRDEIEALADAGFRRRRTETDELENNAAWVGGRWLGSNGGTVWERRNPARWHERLEDVAQSSATQIEQAAAAAVQAQRHWAACTPEERGARLDAFVQALQARREALIQAMVTEVGKPLGDAGQEVERALALARLAISDFCGTQPWQGCGVGVHARRQPVGVVAAITPFNHPLAIAIGKLIPALALGNAVVWKPALPALRTTQLVIEASAAAGLPQGLVAAVLGDAEVAQRLAQQPRIARVSITASIAAGRQLAAACGALLKPLQAELGGNNAVVVMGDADVARIADAIARSAFSFAGQRCTAARRILVEQRCYPMLMDALTAATQALRVGEPGEAATEVGPLISRTRQQAVAAAVAGAVQGGARVLCGGGVPRGLDEGCWYMPTLITGCTPDSALFQEETFGPVAVIHPFTGIGAAIALVNAVPHGLVATLYSGDESMQRRFLAEAEAGVLKLNCAPAGVHAEAPFGGWKDSGFGPPEHGSWDAEFYTRIQALYGWAGHAAGQCQDY